MREIEPALHGDFVGGFVTESDSSGDIHKFTIGLARACARRGADLRFGTEVDAVTTVDGGVRVTVGGRDEAFDGVVIAAGVRSRDLAAALGDRVNIYPVKGYSITVDLKDEASQAAAPGSACSTTAPRSWRAASARTGSASRGRPSSTA